MIVVLCMELLNSVQRFCKGNSSCVRVNDGIKEWFEIIVGVCSNFIVTLLLFNVFMDWALPRMS